MKQVFNGLHILKGYDTIGFPYGDQRTQLVPRMKGTNGYQIHRIRTAWMWAEPCGDYYLPGYGTFCSAPAIRDGAYDVRYDYFGLVDD